MRLLPALLTLLITVFPIAKGDLVISEFCASNQNGIEDEDDDRPDWVEIFNPDATPADLTDWYLTDNAAAKDKWRFPAVTIPPGGYLLVFASDKNRRVPGQPLHTNFSLGAGGEYLGLVRPDAQTVVSQYNPSFPAQFPDLSYGIPSNVTNTTFFAETATGQWTIPTSANSPLSSWRQVSFNTSGWKSTSMGVGYDRVAGGVDYNLQIGSNGNTDTDMTTLNNASCYLRVPFTVTPGTQTVSLKLRVKYDDGFIAWINGKPLLSGGTQVRRNSLTSPVWNSPSAGQRDDTAGAAFEDFNITESIGLLESGQNLLAIQAFNHTPNTTDFLIRPELVGETVVAGGPLDPGYFSVPTPGARNSGVSGMVIPQNVVFSATSGTFTAASFNLTLSGAVAGQQIRYTTDGTTPTATSPLYGGSIGITTTTVVRARIVSTATGALGFIGAAHYEKLGATAMNYPSSGQIFKSCLPIVVLNNRGGGEIGDAKENARIQIYDRDGSGFASLVPGTEPVLSMNASVNLRGRSSSGFPKKSYGIELLDENGAEKVAEVLGMPAGEDWALIACWEYDRAFMRNAWIYEMSRQAGRWAPRTRLVEVFFNQDGYSNPNDPSAKVLSYNDNDYRGVYILVESIRRGEDRVDVAKIEPSHTTLPAVSGGYIFKVDPPEGDEFSWTTSRSLPPPNTGGDNLVIHRPKLADLAPQQSSYLVNYFQTFENALFTGASGGFSNRTYRNYIDSESWADHNLFCTLAKNVDALRLSAYFHKDRGGKMQAGPLWDFDRSVNSTDGRDDDTSSWNGGGDATHYHEFAWWQQLFQDVEFRQTYVDRWQKMRRTTLSTANVNSVLNGFLAEFRPGDTINPAKRDYERWYDSPTSNDITNETNVMKNWLSARSAWMDSQFTAQPTIVRPAGPITAGSGTLIGVPPGTTVYYTVDGTDPRAEGGGFSASAFIYTAGSPVPINATMKVIARAWRSGSFAVPSTNWSGPVESLYLVDETYATADTLRVSAINYGPLSPDMVEAAAIPEAADGDFEWIELKNISGGAVNLIGVSLGEDAPAAATTLPAFTLAPGARALVAKNPQAFAVRYGSAAAARIVAEWTGDGSLDNGGETISVMDRSGGVIAEFAYDDEGDWPEATDGNGSSLEYIGTGNSASDYEDPFNWQASAAVHGNPGLTQTPAPGTVTVNEILANTSLPQRDAIELHNSGTLPVDIGGWFLSNVAAPASGDDFRTFRIPNGTTIAAGGFLVFGESSFSPAGEMSLDGNRGGHIRLVSADPVTGKLHNFEEDTEWSPVLPGIAYGRSPDGTGPFAPLAVYTPATANSTARVGPVQITGIHYHPAGVTPEFIEISNTGSSTESLAKWTLRGDVDIDFPAGFSIAPAEAIVLVAFDPVALAGQTALFRSQYGVPAAVRIIGPWSPADSLGDLMGTVRLRRLVPPPAEDPGFVGLMVEDEVNYLAEAPWPATASGSGSSIHRFGVRRQGSDPAAWFAGSPAPGSGVGGYTAWSLANFPSAGGNRSDDPDHDGLENLIEYLLGSDPGTFTTLASLIDPNGGDPRFVLDYTLRKDRDDGVLSAHQSGDLESWLPAEHDELISDDGTTESRRAWLPIGTKAFLRLEAIEAP